MCDEDSNSSDQVCLDGVIVVLWNIDETKGIDKCWKSHEEICEIVFSDLIGYLISEVLDISHMRVRYFWFFLCLDHCCKDYIYKIERNHDIVAACPRNIQKVWRLVNLIIG